MRWSVLPVDRFAEHSAAWDALQRRCADTPFFESSFIAPLLTVFGAGSERLALGCDESGALQVAAILRPVGVARWETFQPSQLPLGAWLMAPELDVAVAARELLGQLPGVAVTLGLTQLDPALTRPPAAGRACALKPYLDTSYIDVAGSFDDYWAARGKNLRQNVRKLRHRLEAEGLTAQLDCISDDAGVEAALTDYAALEAAGWKASTGTAVGAGDAQGRFYARMFKAFCAAGRGRIYRYRFGDRVVAMDLCIDNGGPLVVILKTAYDEATKQLSPAVLMRQVLFEQWWREARYRRIEFYGRTMEWHTRWTDQQRSLYHATVYRWPWLMLMRNLARGRLQLPTVAASAPSA